MISTLVFKFNIYIFIYSFSTNYGWTGRHEQENIGVYGFTYDP